MSRQSEWLLPPQPLLPQGRHGCAVDATTRCGTRHGPHSASPLGPNQRDDRRAHRGGDVHRRRVDADEQARGADQRRQLGQRELPGEVDDRRACVAALIASTSARFGRVGRAGQHERPAVAASRSSSAAVGCRRPALEQPARARVDHARSARARGRAPPAARATRASASAPGTSTSVLSASSGQMPMRRSASRFGLDGVARRRARQQVAMREARAPEPAGARALGRHAVARAGEARQPRAARMLGEVDDEVVVPRAQRAPQPPFAASCASGPRCLEAAVDRVHDRRSPDARRASAPFRGRRARRSRRAARRASAP